MDSSRYYSSEAYQLATKISGVLSQTVDATRMTTTIPLRLPNDTVNLSDFYWYTNF